LVGAFAEPLAAGAAAVLPGAAADPPGAGFAPGAVFAPGAAFDAPRGAVAEPKFGILPSAGSAPPRLSVYAARA
jgi:hypothetical protein